MTTLKLKCFTKPGVLKRIGRALLTRFFEQFAPQLNSNGLSLPPPEISDADFFNSLARLLMRPEALPDALNEALVAVDDLSTPQGFESLEKSPGWAAHQSLLKPESTREDIALQLWLADREFIINVHNRLRLTGLTVFEYAGHDSGRTDAARTASGATTDSLSTLDSRLSALDISPLDKAAIGTLTLALDQWFAINHRGSETTRIEVYPLRGEYWFLIRHGDVF